MPPDVVPKNTTHTWIWISVAACVIAILLGAYLWYFPLSNGSVRILVRDISGTKSVYQVSLFSGSKAQDTTVDAASVSTVPSRIFRLKDGSVVTLNDTGVVTRQGSSKGELAVLISSTERPTLMTPFAVWGDAEKIAWVNPADNSLQVFERTARGTYTPVFLDSTIHVNSIVFTEDGTRLVAAQVRATQTGESTTELYVVDLKVSSITALSTITGFATILP